LKKKDIFLSSTTKALAGLIEHNMLQNGTEHYDENFSILKKAFEQGNKSISIICHLFRSISKRELISTNQKSELRELFFNKTRSWIQNDKDNRDDTQKANNGRLLDSEAFLSVLYGLKQNEFPNDELDEYLQSIVNTNDKLVKTIKNFRRVIYYSGIPHKYYEVNIEDMLNLYTIDDLNKIDSRLKQIYNTENKEIIDLYTKAFSDYKSFNQL